jgi:hypothetical protein
MQLVKNNLTRIGIIIPMIMTLCFILSCGAGLSITQKNDVRHAIYGYGFNMVNQETVDDGYSPEGYPKYCQFYYFINRNTGEKITLMTYTGDTDKNHCCIFICKKNHETWANRFSHLKYVRVGPRYYQEWESCD